MGLIQTRGSRHWRESISVATLKTYDVFDLFKTTNVNNKIVNSSSQDHCFLDLTRDNYSTLVPYLGDADKVLVGGRSNNGKRVPSVDTNAKTLTYSCANTYDTDSWCLFPIQRVNNVYKLKLTFMFTAKYNNYKNHCTVLYQVDGNELKSVLVDPKSMLYIDRDNTYNLNSWYTVETEKFSSLLSCDYIGFGAAVANVIFKDIQLFAKE